MNDPKTQPEVRREIPVAVAAGALLLTLWGLVAFLFATYAHRPWKLAESLVLEAAIFGLGLVFWAWARATEPEADAMRLSNRWLRPFAIAGVIVLIVTTVTHGQPDWLLTWFAAEAVLLVIAAVVARETLFVGLAMATLASGAITFLDAKPPTFAVRSVAWTNLLGGLALMIVAERLFHARQSSLLFYDQTRRRLRVSMVAMVTIVALFGLRALVAGTALAVGWAVAGFVLMTLGLAGKERSYQIAGLVILACSLAQAVFRLGT